MEYVELGNTGIIVSKLGLGALTMGKLQKGCDTKTIQRVVAQCAERGITLVDGAELYDCYEVLHEMVRANKNCVVASKSYAYDLNTAKKAFEESLREIGRDYIDIFLMHEQESEWTIKGHHEALEYYMKMKEKGYVRAVGLSTHRIECVRATAKFPEIEIVHPLINYKGYGLFDGTRKDMEDAIEDCNRRGVGTYAMKIFGGGHLLADRQEAIKYLLSNSFIDACVIGMQTIDEVSFNADMFEKGTTSLDPTVMNKHVEIGDWCVKCMECAKVCPQNAISLVNNVVTVNDEKCVLCGYCGSACKEMAIKLF